jgi:lipoyl synthase
LESPTYVQISLAAAMALGYEAGQFRRNAVPTGLNLLLHYEDGCAGRCGYCGLNPRRDVAPEKRTFIRVGWPIYPVEDVLARLQQEGGNLRRVCVGMITHRRAFEDMNEVIRLFATRTGRPVSALLTPTLIKDLTQLAEVKAAGADRVGIAIDAATPALFERWRGAGVKGPHRWEHYGEAIAESVRTFGRGMVGTHLVVGLGETEREMVALIQHLNDLGAVTHLFSFFPEQGTPMGDSAQPSYGHYRRVQLARYIVNEGRGRYEQMRFDECDRLVDFGVPTDELVQFGLPFMTSGCPGPDGQVACNRPFGNERPGQPFRNYPFLPEPEDIELIRYQLREYEEPA